MNVYQRKLERNFALPPYPPPSKKKMQEHVASKQQCCHDFFRKKKFIFVLLNLVKSEPRGTILPGFHNNEGIEPKWGSPAFVPVSKVLL